MLNEPAREILHALQTEIDQVPPAIYMQDVTVYRGSNPVLREVELCLDEGKTMGIIGPTGAGKSTLVNAVLGRARIKEGMLELFGVPVRKAKRNMLNIGYLAEANSIPDHFPATALDVVKMGLLSNKGIFSPIGSDDTLYAQYLISEFKLERLQNQLFSSLARGEQQRILMARALASQPRLLVLDNPTQNLDPAGKKQIQEILKETQRQSGMAILLTSQDPRFAAEMCDSIVCLNGSVHWIGKAKDLTPAQVKEVFQCNVYFRNPHYRGWKHKRK